MPQPRRLSRRHDHQPPRIGSAAEFYGSTIAIPCARKSILKINTHTCIYSLTGAPALNWRALAPCVARNRVIIIDPSGLIKTVAAAALPQARARLDFLGEPCPASPGRQVSPGLIAADPFSGPHAVSLSHPPSPRVIFPLLGASRCPSAVSHLASPSLTRHQVRLKPHHGLAPGRQRPHRREPHRPLVPPRRLRPYIPPRAARPTPR